MTRMRCVWLTVLVSPNDAYSPENNAEISSVGHTGI